MSLSGKHILLIVTGGIAAYKALELVRLIKKAGGTVQPILTEAATEFVTPLSLSTLAGNAALTALFDLTREAEIGHIELSRSADLIVVAPASADFIAKMANGFANDLASTTILATDTPIMIAPAMNVRMWEAAATKRNMALVESDGVTIIGPDDGDMACGEFGPGRMSEPASIVNAMERHFEMAANGPLEGRHVIVTSGPTREWLDPVRYISNASSGKQGVAIAEALAALGADVSFVTGPAEYATPKGCTVIGVTSAQEMHDMVTSKLPADAAIFCAAVADWRAADASKEKIKKTAEGTPPHIALAANRDILADISNLEDGQRPRLVVGFAAETENLLANARAKFDRKGCDWLIANDVSPGSGTFGGDESHVIVLDSAGEEDWGRLSKRETARRLCEKIAAHLRADKD